MKKFIFIIIFSLIFIPNVFAERTYIDTFDSAPNYYSASISCGENGDYLSFYNTENAELTIRALWWYGENSCDISDYQQASQYADFIVYSNNELNLHFDTANYDMPDFVTFNLFYDLDETYDMSDSASKIGFNITATDNQILTSIRVYLFDYRHEYSHSASYTLAVSNWHPYYPNYFNIELNKSEFTDNGLDWNYVNEIGFDIEGRNAFGDYFNLYFDDIYIEPYVESPHNITIIPYYENATVFSPYDYLHINASFYDSGNDFFSKILWYSETGLNGSWGYVASSETTINEIVGFATSGYYLPSTFYVKYCANDMQYLELGGSYQCITHQYYIDYEEEEFYSPTKMYFKLDEGIGNYTYDSSGYGFIGNLTPSLDGILPIWENASNCKVGTSCIKFTDYYDRIEIGIDKATNITRNVTAGLWFKPSKNLNSTIETDGYLIEKSGEYGLTFCSGDIAPEDCGKIIFKIYSDANEFYVYSTTENWLENTWYHIAGVYDYENLYIYVNGILENTTYIGNNPLNSNYNSIIIGTYQNWTIDEIKVMEGNYTFEELTEFINISANASNQINLAIDSKTFNINTKTWTYYLSWDTYYGADTYYSYFKNDTGNWEFNAQHLTAKRSAIFSNLECNTTYYFNVSVLNFLYNEIASFVISNTTSFCEVGQDYTDITMPSDINESIISQDMYDEAMSKEDLINWLDDTIYVLFVLTIFVLMMVLLGRATKGGKEY